MFAFSISAENEKLPSKWNPNNSFSSLKDSFHKLAICFIPFLFEFNVNLKGQKSNACRQSKIHQKNAMMLKQYEEKHINRFDSSFFHFGQYEVLPRRAARKRRKKKCSKIATRKWVKRICKRQTCEEGSFRLFFVIVWKFNQFVF